MLIIFRDKVTQSFVGCMLLLAGFFVLKLLLSQPKIKDKEALSFITGKLESHSFIDGTKGTHDYTFIMSEYSNRFQIKAEFKDLFDYYGFDVLNAGTNLKIAISKADLRKLNVTDERLLVYSIVDQDDGAHLLDYNLAIEKQNSPFPYFMAIASLLSGLIILYITYNVKTKPSKPL